MFKKITSVLLSLILVCLLFAGCSNVNEQNEKDNGKLNVVCTIFPQYDFIRAIAGDKVNLKMIVPCDHEFSSYKPSKKDLKTIEKADLFVCVGNSTDIWSKEIVEGNENKNFNYVELTNICDHILAMDEHGNYIPESLHYIDEYSVIDDRVWESLQNSMVIVSNLSAWLCNLDPDNADYYKENARKYMDEIAKVDLLYSEISDGAYDAELSDSNPFNYIFSDYGLNAITTPELEKMGVNTMEKISKKDFESGMTYVDIVKSNYEILKNI